MKNECIPASQKTAEFENWLNSFLNFEKLPQKNMFWLDTMEFFCEKLRVFDGFPPSVHIAGSKGKGSVAAMTSAILEEAGIKTGLYTSPHITTFLERISENGEFFPLPVYEKSAAELKECVEKYKAEFEKTTRPVTWFELVTLYAFLCFKNAKAGAAVFETGLGGRLDATNVIHPAVSCITTIELEHTEFLGGTLEKIAAEKAGIIKEKTPVVVAAQRESVKEVFRKAAAQKHAPVYFVDEIYSNITAKTPEIICNCQKNNTSSEKNVSVSMKTVLESDFFSSPLRFNLRLAGEFQAQNAALAALAVRLAFPEITERQIERGLSKAFLPARFEIQKNIPGYKAIPFLLLDGAHTPGSVSFTLQTMEKVFPPDEKFNLLFACAADKNAVEIASLVKNHFSKIFITKPGNTKQTDIEKIKSAFAAAGIEFACDEDFIRQIRHALSVSNDEKRSLAVTGSFYLVSEVKKFLRDMKTRKTDIFAE